MQSIASSTQRVVATPTAGARGVCAPLRTTIAIGVQQQQQQQQQHKQAQQRSAIVLQAAASASDIREIENMVVDQAAAAAGSTGMLPSGNVKVRVWLRVRGGWLDCRAVWAVWHMFLLRLGVAGQQQQQQANAAGADVPPPLHKSAAAAAAASFLCHTQLRVRMRGYDIAILAKACEQIKLVAGLTGARIAGPVMLPTKKRVYCVLRSPHVNKDAREHFEIRIHNRLMDVTNLSSQTVQALMEWVPPSGLEVETSIV
jgi:small subunit ribosomal protein S10